MNIIRTHALTHKHTHTPFTSNHLTEADLLVWKRVRRRLHVLRLYLVFFHVLRHPRLLLLHGNPPVLVGVHRLPLLEGDLPRVLRQPCPLLLQRHESILVGIHRLPLRLGYLPTRHLSRVYGWLRRGDCSRGCRPGLLFDRLCVLLQTQLDGCLCFIVLCD